MNDSLQTLGVLIATALLTIGIFFLLYVVSPFVAGLFTGFILAERRKGIIVAFLGTSGGFLILQIVTLNGVIDYLITQGLIVLPLTAQDYGLLLGSIIIASVILGILGALGGFLGAQVSTIRSPGLKSA